jgi:hypothetical protein
MLFYTYKLYICGLCKKNMSNSKYFNIIIEEPLESENEVASEYI